MTEFHFHCTYLLADTWQIPVSWSDLTGTCTLYIMNQIERHLFGHAREGGRSGVLEIPELLRFQSQAVVSISGKF